MEHVEILRTPSYPDPCNAKFDVLVPVSQLGVVPEIVRLADLRERGNSPLPKITGGPVHYIARAF